MIKGSKLKYKLLSEWDKEDADNFMINSIPLGKDGFDMWNKRNLFSD